MERIAIDLSLLQEIDFWLAFWRENNVVVKLGVARLVADFGTRAVIR